MRVRLLSRWAEFLCHSTACREHAVEGLLGWEFGAEAFQFGNRNFGCDVADEGVLGEGTAA
jgi:hypothetical protein